MTQMHKYVFGKDEIVVPDGCSVRDYTDEPRYLALDLDSDASVRQMIRMLPVADRRWGIEQIYLWESRGGNVHAVLCLHEELEITVRIGLQVAMGSDPMRGLLWYAQTDSANVLFYPRRGGETGDPEFDAQKGIQAARALNELRRG